MNYISDAMSGLFSLGGVIGFMVGAIASRCYYFAAERYKNKHEPSGNPHKIGFRNITLLWVLIFIVTGYISFQQQETANRVRSLSANTAECQKEFFQSLQDRSVASDQTDEWSRQKTLDITNWLRTVLFPPPDLLAIRAQNPQDPRYQNWVLTTTSGYLEQIDTLEKAQEASINYRQTHPLPEPTCGK